MAAQGFIRVQSMFDSLNKAESFNVINLYLSSAKNFGFLDFHRPSTGDIVIDVALFDLDWLTR
jgi:hypothetical protein